MKEKIKKWKIDEVYIFNKSLIPQLAEQMIKILKK